MTDPDLLEGCLNLDFAEDPTTDDLLPWVVLFASVLGHPVRILVRAAEWRLLFGAHPDDADFVMGVEHHGFVGRLFNRDDD